MNTITDQRAAHYAAAHSRPGQRRSAAPAGSDAHVRAVVSGLELREAGNGEPIVFTGYASITDRAYGMWDLFGEYDEIVKAGAFTSTLAQAELDVPLVLQHNQLRRIARTTNGTLALSEDGLGLRVEGTLDPADEDVAYIVPKLRSGLIDEMSFAFRIVSGSWSDDWMTYTINEVDMHRGDVAIVGFGANPYTEAGVRSQEKPAPMTRQRVHPDELRDRVL